ncbi:MAG: hypothetical protein AAF358_08725 [Pseudomonadota bacterium]
MTLLKALVFMGCFSAGVVQAAELRDQHFNPRPMSDAPLAEGYNVGQSFTVGLSGDLVQIDVAMDCKPGGDVTLALYSENPPGSVDRWRLVHLVTRASGSFPENGGAWPDYQGIRVPATPVVAGDHMMWVLKHNGDGCRHGFAPVGLYPDGKMGTFVGGVLLEFADEGYDMAFATYVAVPDDNTLCRFDLYGRPSGRIPAWVPVCGCLSDIDANALQCRFDLPELVLFREIPLFENVGEIDFTLVPLVELETVKIDQWAGDDLFESPVDAPTELSQLEAQSWTTPFSSESAGPINLRIDTGEAVYQFQIPSNFPEEP